MAFNVLYELPATALRENIKSPLFAANAFRGRIWFPALPGLYRNVGRVTPSLRGRNRNCSLSARYWTMARRIGLEPKWCHKATTQWRRTANIIRAPAIYSTVHQFDHRDKCAFIGAILVANRVTLHPFPSKGHKASPINHEIPSWRNFDFHLYAEAATRCSMLREGHSLCCIRRWIVQLRR